MEKMTIQRGLSKLKLVEKRIKQLTQRLEIASIEKNGEIHGFTSGEASQESFNKTAISGYDTLISLLTERDTIKNAIIQANANTLIKIGEESMTIAQAIEKKNSIALKEELLERLRKNYHSVTSYVTKENERIEEQLSNLLNSKFSGSSKTTESDMKLIQEAYRKTNAISVYDPIDIVSKIKALEEEIDTFKSEVDLALSEANNTNYIS